MSKAPTRCACEGRVLRKITSRSSRQGVNESNVFFIVLIAIWNNQNNSRRVHELTTLTMEPLRATEAPPALTRAKATLPKLPSPISLMTSNRSSSADIELDNGLWPKSVITVIMLKKVWWGATGTSYRNRYIKAVLCCTGLLWFSSQLAFCTWFIFAWSLFVYAHACMLLTDSPDPFVETLIWMFMCAREVELKNEMVE